MAEMTRYAVAERLRSHYLDLAHHGDTAENCHCGLRTHSRYERALHLADVAIGPPSPDQDTVPCARCGHPREVIRREGLDVFARPCPSCTPPDPESETP